MGSETRAPSGESVDISHAESERPIPIESNLEASQVPKFVGLFKEHPPSHNRHRIDVDVINRFINIRTKF